MCEPEEKFLAGYAKLVFGNLTKGVKMLLRINNGLAPVNKTTSKQANKELNRNEGFRFRRFDTTKYSETEEVLITSRVSDTLWWRESDRLTEKVVEPKFLSQLKVFMNPMFQDCLINI